MAGDDNPGDPTNAYTPANTADDKYSRETNTTCYLLNIAPELRNRIYEYAFTTTDGADYFKDILSAAFPAKDLLLTCRQVYNEATGLYKLLFRQYWEESSFVLDRRATPTSATVLRADPAKDLQRLEMLGVNIAHIRTCHALATSANYHTVRHSYQPDDVSWLLQSFKSILSTQPAHSAEVLWIHNHNYDSEPDEERPELAPVSFEPEEPAGIVRASLRAVMRYMIRGWPPE